MLEPIGVPLSAQIDSPDDGLTIEIGQSVNFAASATGGTIPRSFSWNFGNDSGISPITAEDPGYRQFDTPGTYKVELTVTDADGKEALDSAAVIVEAPTMLNEGITSSRITELKEIKAMVDADWAGSKVPYPLLTTGYDGTLVVDLTTGEELVTDFYLEFASVLGGFFLQAQDAPETANHRDTLVEFGYAGCQIFTYDAETSQFAAPEWMICASAVYDTVPFNGDSGSGGLIYVVKFGRVAFVIYDENQDKRVFDHVYMSQFPSL